jgi:thiosulfate reductase cytochrome b subunit
MITTLNLLLKRRSSRTIIIGAFVLTLTVLAACAILVGNAFAGAKLSAPLESEPFHPSFALLDVNGDNVLSSNQPVSTMKTCGVCHDTEYIASHNGHAEAGVDEFSVRNAEINCFICHTANPNNAERTAMLEAGRFDWASTATLLGSGLVNETNDMLTWNPQAFDANGELKPEFVVVQNPTSLNCGQCHSIVHTSDEPLVVTDCQDTAEGLLTRTSKTGQVISDQRISTSGLNLSGKETISRSWDVHAERALECTDCHYSLNNPAYVRPDSGLEHLTFDPRRLEPGEYLERPSHILATGERSCADCHSIEATHNWLPYKESHISVVSCESCHVPKLYAPAAAYQDQTVVVLDKAGEAQTTCRGIEGEVGAVESLVTGYTPVLMPRLTDDGETLVTPYNLVTTWKWVSGESANPIPEATVQAAWLEEGDYAPEVTAAFDTDQSGVLETSELVIDTPEKEAVIASRLTAQGVSAPRIVGQIEPYPIHHSIAEGEWAIRDCAACHGEDSLITAGIELANRVPGGVIPTFTENENIVTNGEIIASEDGSLIYQPVTAENRLYVLGHDRVGWIDLLGGLMFLGVLGGVSLHGGLRFYATLRHKPQRRTLKRVYMYAVYERLWHWLQTFTILLLIFTGLVIHKPDVFGIFSFAYVVLVHNIAAGVLVVNAALSLFYHLVSGEIQQYIPRPYGFFDQAIVQAKFYLEGIFKHAPHPFEKTPERKLNPLQQVTYFGILNVLLPLQVLTGLAMWGAQEWPEITTRLGGLAFLAPFHTLVAWSFAAFIVMHVYLTTTGHEPLAGIRAMMYGWDEVEAPSHEQPTSEANPPADTGAEPVIQPAD